MSKFIVSGREFVVVRVLDYGDAVEARTSSEGTTDCLLGAECELTVNDEPGTWRVIECAERRWTAESGEVAGDVTVVLARVSSLARLTRFAAQRRDRGFDDSELWNLDVTLAEHAIPRLEALGECGQGCYVDGELKSLKDVCAVIVDGLRAYLETDFDVRPSPAARERVTRGWKTLVRHFGTLWC